jgi:undecaprenyl-phosphate galactose phosphotransferase
MESSDVQPRLRATRTATYIPKTRGPDPTRPPHDDHIPEIDLHLVDGDAFSKDSPEHPKPSEYQLKTLDGGVVKRAFDIIGAILIGLLFSPFIIAVVIIIRLGGLPVLFQHKRIGRDGKVFNCLKFRTMAPNAEQVLRNLLRTHPELRDEWTENHKLRDDPRVTLIGGFLRRSSLDELPQLWNVLRGDMSLVGPRPIVRAELLRYGRQASTCLAVRPGLTGLWQIKGRSDTTYRRRVAMDKYYVHSRTLWMDMYIVAFTAVVVLRRAGAY